MNQSAKPASSMPFIALGLFGLYAVEFGVVGILPVIVERFGVSVFQAGLLISLFALIIAFLGPILVLMTSRFDRKSTLAWTLLGFTVCSVFTAYATHFSTLMVLRVIPALMHPIFFSAAFATAASLYRRERAAQATSHAFVGTTLGIVFGVPLMTWVAARFGYEASFLFCAAVTLLAGLGLVAMLPRPERSEPLSFGHQVAVLKKGALWLSIVTSILVFSAGFAVYSYAAEFLRSEAHMDGQTISLILVVFGVGGFAGNLAAGALMTRSPLATALGYPIALAAAYVILEAFSTPSVLVMALVALVWGAAHTSGLVVTQTWLTSVATEAPEFANSLYLSSANAGVVLGSFSGGMAIETFGTRGVIWCGILFSVLSLATIAAKAQIYGLGSERRKALGTAVVDTTI
ncbi:MFS transporter [Roseateles noduli]|uniref:MFS transporter n=1 Tax=Roseateles noduli TaxID=2052484 RepID=UPI003D6525EE